MAYFQFLMTALVLIFSIFFREAWRDWGEYSFLISGFLTAGLFHGSADLLLIRRLSSSKRSRGTAFWLVIYLGVIGAVLSLLIAAPQITLLVFLGISIFHFGESQFWEARMTGGRAVQGERLALQVVWGSWVILSPLVLHADATIRILGSLGSHPDIIQALAPLRESPELSRGIGGGLGMAATVGLLWCLGVRGMSSGRGLLRELFCLGALQVVYFHTSLLTSFAVYFVIWHSLTSLRDQVLALDFMAESRIRTEAVGRESSIGIYIRWALPYWAAAGAALLVGMFLDGVPGTVMDRTGLLFAGAILLTPPHALVLSFLNRRMTGERVPESGAELDITGSKS